MFKQNRKDECQRIRELVSPYLDGYLTAVEQDSVTFHVDLCESCRHELDSLSATIQMISCIPIVAIPRSFTLTEAQVKRSWFHIGLPSLNGLRVATASAMVMFGIMLASDLTGLLNTDATPVADQPVSGYSLDSSSKTDGELILSMPPDSGPIDAPPPLASEISNSTTDGIGAKVDDSTFGEREVDSPPPSSLTSPWLRPLEIILAAMVAILGGATLLIQRKRRNQ